MMESIKLHSETHTFLTRVGKYVITYTGNFPSLGVKGSYRVTFLSPDEIHENAYDTLETGVGVSVFYSFDEAKAVMEAHYKKTVNTLYDEISGDI